MTEHSVTRSTASARSAPCGDQRVVPEATVSRLALYLRVLTSLVADDSTTVSSEELAMVAGVGSAKLRKDLSFLGPNGTRGVGYDAPRLIARLEQALGLNRRHEVALVGVGNLGRALAAYDGFGVRCVLNFAPVVLRVSDTVDVRKVDLAAEMQVLSFRVAHRAVAERDKPVQGASMQGETMQDETIGMVR